jgi:indolepyruvate ferredoxin oxidoreductase
MTGDEPEAPKTLDQMSLDEIIARRTQHLTGYQNEAYAARYVHLVEQVRKVAFDGGYGEALPRAVAINYAKLLAYKDEYEVARLFTDSKFMETVNKQFDGNFKMSFNLAPPILPGKDASGRPRKRSFGPWMLPVFGLLTKMRFLRGTIFDPFGHSEDRKLERNLIKGYEQDVVTAVKLLSPRTHNIAVELLSLPDQIRGYGPVKEASVKKAKARYEQLAKDLVNPPELTPQPIAAE